MKDTLLVVLKKQAIQAGREIRGHFLRTASGSWGQKKKKKKQGSLSYSLKVVNSAKDQNELGRGLQASDKTTAPAEA